MTIQFLICIPLVPILFLLTSVSTTARSLAVIDDSLTRGRLTWNAIEPRQKQIDGRNLEKSEIRVPIESKRPSVFGRIQHYVGTHKELLASDALLIATLSADAASSIHCPVQECVETNGILPNNPSEFVYWGYFTGLEAIYVTASHLWWHRHPDSPWRHIAWAAPISYAIYEVPNVRFNVDTDKIGRLQQARARVAR
jgi:hypothetical protein